MLLLNGSRECCSALIFWHKNKCSITKPRCDNGRGQDPEGVMAECHGVAEAGVPGVAAVPGHS